MNNWSNPVLCRRLFATVLLASAQTTPLANAQDVKPEDLSVSALSVESQYDLCPQGTIAQSNSSKSIVSLLFDAAWTSGDEESSSVSKSCEVVIPLEITDGYRIADPLVCIAYDITIPEGSKELPEIALGFGYEGGATTWMKRKPEASHYECFTSPLPASDSCGDAAATKLVLSLAETAPPGVLIAVDDITLNFDYDGGAKWLSCGEAPLPGPAGFHEDCGGRNERACAEDLECKRPTTNNGFPSGKCVRPCEHIASMNESCGGKGLDEVLCEVGLDCKKPDGEDFGVCKAS